MTLSELKKIEEIGSCTMLPGSWDKKFARNMVMIAGTKPETTLSAKQLQFVNHLHHKYREQIERLKS